MTAARLRDRPAALAFAWASVALPACFAAIPVAGVVGALFGDRLDGDASLFRPGGEPLLETLRIFHRELIGVAVAAPWLAAAYAWCALTPWASLLIALADPSRQPLSAVVARALARLPTLTMLFGLGLAGRALVLALGSAATSSLGGASANERTATLLSAAGIAATVAVFGALRVLHDLASAAACRHQTTTAHAALHALATLADRPAGLLLPWCAFATARVALVLFAAWATTRLGVASGVHLFLVLAVHQTTLFGLVALRALWLRRAVAAVGRDDPAARATRGELA